MAVIAISNRQAASRTAALLAPALVLLALAPPAGAQAVRIGEPDCARGVHLVVEGVPKADVLRELARAWNFRLDIGAVPLAPVRIDAVGWPDELIARLLDTESFMLLRQPDRRCPGRTAIARLFVVGSGPLTTARAPSPPLPPVAAPPPTAEAVELTDNYLRSHGIGRPAAR